VRGRIHDHGIESNLNHGRGEDDEWKLLCVEGSMIMELNLI
jgi:hypothetical protein